MKRGLKGFAFLVSGLVLGIIGGLCNCNCPECCRHGKGAPCQQVKRRKKHDS